MTVFLKQSMTFAGEFAEETKQTIRVHEEFCQKHGKHTAVSLTLLENQSNEVFTTKIASNEAYSLKGGKVGGEYEIFLSKGYVLRLCYLYEIFSRGWFRHRERNSTNEIRVPVHHDQNEPVSVYFPSKNFFRLDLKRSLFDEFNLENDLFDAATKFEASFWPFEFSGMGFSEVAKALAKHALNFLILHELGHISRGHFEYIEETRGRNAHLAQHKENLAEGDTIMARCMELAADTQAIENQLLNLVQGDDRDNWTSFVDLFVHAIGFLFATSDLNARTTATYSSSQHPDADMRFVAVMSYLSACIQDEYPDELKERMRDLRRSWMEAPVIATKLLREIGVLSGGFSVYLGWHASDKDTMFFQEMSKLTSQLKKNEIKWTHRCGYQYEPNKIKEAIRDFGNEQP